MTTDTLHRSKTITVQNLLDDTPQLLNFLDEHHCIALIVDDAGKPFAKTEPFADAILDLGLNHADEHSPVSNRSRRTEAET